VVDHARRRQLLRLAWNFALIYVVAAMVAGVWLAFIAWKLASQPLGMLAAILLLSAPMLAVAVMLARPDDPAVAGNPPASAFVAAIHRVDDVLRIVRLSRAHVGVASSFVFVLWFCQLTGYVRLMEFLVFYTFACMVTAAACLPWLASCERRLHDARAEYRRLLGDVERFSAPAVLL
jgi:hypothetical protein